MSREEFSVPHYLLKTAFGEKLQNKLITSVSNVKGESQIARLSVLGLMGNMPSRYIENGYDTELVEMLGRAATAGSASHNSTIQPSSSSSRLPEDDYQGSIHYANDAMDLDVIDDEDDQDSNDDDDMDRVSTRSLSLRRNSRKNSKSFHTLSSSNTSSNFKYPLPTRWLSTPSNALVISPNGLDLKVESNTDHLGSTSSAKSYDYYVTRADSTIPLSCGVYYFEIKIQSVTNSNLSGACDVSIGFLNASEAQTVNKMPGLEAGSYGFSGNDGKIIANQSSVSRGYSRKFGLNDVIGCCVNFTKKIIFFTKNGVKLGNAFLDVKSDLIPIIGLRNGNAVSTNFGHDSEFLFDISGYISSEKCAIQKKIYNSTEVDLSGSDYPDHEDDRKNKYTDKEIPNLLQNLVGAYFEHLGYVDIAKVFKQEVLEEQVTQTNGNSDDSMVLDEENLEIRQQIRKHLMSGDIDAGIELTNLKFPKVLANNETILFKLQCQKFIQFIKESKIDEAMNFGQYLRSNFSENPKFQSFLNDIFSLIAYENPSESEQGYLLESKELVKLSDELNSEILKTVGKSSISNLESLLKHNSDILDFLNEQHYPDSLLINTNDFKS